MRRVIEVLGAASAYGLALLVPNPLQLGNTERALDLISIYILALMLDSFVILPWQRRKGLLHAY